MTAPHQGNTSAALALWLSGGSGYRMRMAGGWALPVAPDAPTEALQAPPEAPWVAAPRSPALAAVEPDLCTWSPVPVAQAAERWLDRAQAPALAPDFGGRLPKALALAPATPDLCTWAPVPAAQAAERWLDRAQAEAFVPAFGRNLPEAIAKLLVAPDVCTWAPVPAAQPVERWLECALAPPLAAATAAALPTDLTLAPVTESAPPDLCGWAVTSGAQPVERWLDCALEAPLAAAIATALPTDLTLAPVTESAPPDLCGWEVTPGPQPVERWLDCALAAHVTTVLSVRPPAPLAASPSRLSKQGAGWVALPRPEPVAAFVQSAVATSGWTERYERLRAALPSFSISADLEPLTIPEAPAEPPAPCDRWMTPAAEPVWRFLQSTTAAQFAAGVQHAAPALGAKVAPPYVPAATALRSIPKAEPVMAGVWPRVSTSPLENIGGAPVVFVPAVGGTALSQQPFAAPDALAAPAPEPVEPFRTASAFALPLTGSARTELPGIMPRPAGAARFAECRPCAGPEAQPVETLLTASAGEPMVSAAAIRTQPFSLAASSITRMLEEPRVSAAPAEPAPAVAAAVHTLTPVGRIKVTHPEQRQLRPAPAIPRPGVAALEYHMQSTRGAANGRLEWKSVRFEPLSPRFTLRAILEKLDDIAKPKSSEPASLFSIAAGHRTRSAIMEQILRVAAAVLIVTTIWFTASALRNGRRLAVRQDTTGFATPDRVLTAESQRQAKGNESGGPLNWMRKTVANRASLQVADDFQSGMKSWGAQAGAYPAGWQRSPDGYVETGAIAVFNPTLKFTDYRLEFFSQIESKSVGWAVRARDEKNYHAMKFTVVEAGLRPIIALVHYNVIDGKPGRKIQTPLNVMVHNNQPLQVTVNVRGNHLVTSVDGEEVDTFVSDVLPAGGVGFFSDTGERARLYWTRVTKNDDWLGHVCAFLSGGESTATAELWPPGAPGNEPSPWPPEGGEPTILAAGFGLPYFRRTNLWRQTRCNR